VSTLADDAEHQRRLEAAFDFIAELDRAQRVRQAEEERLAEVTDSVAARIEALKRGRTSGNQR
jgi:hypothetical protein